MPTMQTKSKTYEEFVEKFKPQKTTDDCYTPPAVMDIINEYVEKTFNVSRETFCRPFYPGGDYEHYDYTGKIVVDNPPFSILSNILKFYNDRNIPYFLFCPALTFLSRKKLNGAVVIKTPLIYENGANVATCFITNMMDDIILDGMLSEKIRKVQPIKFRKKKNKRPDGVYTSADLTNNVEPGTVKIIKKEDIEWHNKDKTQYGGCIKLKEGVKI